MAAFAEVLDALYDLISTETELEVSKHDFSIISESGTPGVVLRVGGFASGEESFGGTYQVIWDIYADIYERYSQHIEADIESLIASRDTIISLIQRKTYLGKGPGNVEGIEFAVIPRGDALDAVFDEETTVTHFSLSVLIQVAQQRSEVIET